MPSLTPPGASSNPHASERLRGPRSHEAWPPMPPGPGAEDRVDLQQAAAFRSGRRRSVRTPKRPKPIRWPYFFADLRAEWLGETALARLSLTTPDDAIGDHVRFASGHRARPRRPGSRLRACRLSAGSNARGPGATRSTPCGRPSDGLDRTGRVQGDITGAGSAARGCEGRGDPRVHGAVRLRAHPPRSSVSRPFWEVRPGQRVRRRQLYQKRSTQWR